MKAKIIDGKVCYSLRKLIDYIAKKMQNMKQIHIHTPRCF